MISFSKKAELSDLDESSTTPKNTSMSDTLLGKAGDVLGFQTFFSTDKETQKDIIRSFLLDPLGSIDQMCHGEYDRKLTNWSDDLSSHILDNLESQYPMFSLMRPSIEPEFGKITSQIRPICEAFDEVVTEMMQDRKDRNGV